MKKILRKLRELDEEQLALLQEAIHAELQQRHPVPLGLANERNFRVVGGDDATNSDDSAGDDNPAVTPPKRRRRAV